MVTRGWSSRLAVVGAGLCVWSGCSYQPAAVRPVEIDAAAAGNAAIKAHDNDGNGELSTEELAGIPAILKYRGLYDGDQNGSVSAAEIAARVRKWEADQLGMRELSAIVTLDGAPLAGAMVKFVPEPYLGANVKPASGETDQFGIAAIEMSAEDTPERFRKTNIRGVTGGTFKVEVTHPKKNIPPKFNTQTTLGEEVAVDTVKSSASIELTSH